MTRKLISLLAAFESNIEKNKEFGLCSDGSFISGNFTASSIDGRRRRSITNSQKISPMRDEDEDTRVDYTVRWSPRKTPTPSPTKRSSKSRLPASIVPPPFTDDSESDVSLSACSGLNQSSSSTRSPPEKRVRRVIVKKIKKKRRDSSVDSKGSRSHRSSRHSSSSSSRKSTLSSGRRKECILVKADDAYCSPTEETSSFESQFEETLEPQVVERIQLDRSSELHKNEKSVSSLPNISRNNSNTAGNVSFSSLPVIRPSKKWIPKSQVENRSSSISRNENEAVEKGTGESSCSFVTPPRQSKESPVAPLSPVPARIPASISRKEKKEVEKGSSEASCSLVPPPPRQLEESPVAPLSPVPTRMGTKTYQLSPVPNAIKARLAARKVYPRSPLPNKQKVNAASINIENSEDDENEKPVVLHNAGRKTITVKHCSPNKMPVEAFPSDLSTLTFDSDQKPIRSPKSPRPLLRTSSGGSSWSGGSMTSRSTGASPTFECDPVQLLKLNAKPVSILLDRDHVRNKKRRVKFADQQPGGGRRMSVESLSSRDSLPVRPRRSSLTHMHHLKARNVIGDVLEDFAVTKIQAAVRCWLQYKDTKLVLLERKLVRIEQTRQQELKRIQENKWKVMDSVRRDIVENEKRLDSQVALGDKLIDHLKKDGSLVQEQTKKLKEHIITLKKNNEILEKAASHNLTNFETMSTAIALLKEKEKNLEQIERAYARETERKHTLLEELSTRVHGDIKEGKSLKQGIDRLIALISERCGDKELINEITMLAWEGHRENIDKAIENSFALESSGVFNESSESEGRLEKSLGGESWIFSNSSIASTHTFMSLESKEFENTKMSAISTPNSIPVDESKRASGALKRPTVSYQTSGDSFADYCPSDIDTESCCFRIEPIAEHADE